MATLRYGGVKPGKPLAPNQMNRGNLYGYKPGDFDMSNFNNMMMMGGGRKTVHGDMTKDDYMADLAYKKRYAEDPQFKAYEKANRGHGGLRGALTKGIDSLDDHAKKVVKGLGPMTAAFYGMNALAGQPGLLSTGATASGGIGKGTLPALSPGSGGANLLAGGGAATAGIGAGVLPALNPGSGGPNLLNAAAGLGAVGGNSGIPDWLIPGASLASGLLSHDATEGAIDEQRRQYDQTREDMAPWRNAGVNALSDLQAGIAEDPAQFDFNLEDDEVYKFGRDEALGAAERAMASRGYNNSGNMLNELARRAAGYASQYQNDAFNRQRGEYGVNYGAGQDKLNRLASLSGVGQTTATNLGHLGANAATNVGNLGIAQGEGWNNAIQGGISNSVLNNYLRNNYGF